MEDKSARETKKSQLESQGESRAGTGKHRAGRRRLGEEDWSVMTVLAKWQRRVMSEADLMPGQSLVAFSYRGQ